MENCYCFSATDYKYDYLIDGTAMSELQAFIASEESTYEQYIEVLFIV